jgi:hypothetical protein
MKRAALLVGLVLLFVATSANAQVTVSGALVGNGPYATLSAAFTAINGGAQTGANISIAISGNTTEPTVVGASSVQIGAGAWASILIQPTGGAWVVSGAATAGWALIEFNGADNVKIDGLNSGGNALTISNTTVSPTSRTSTLQFLGGATNNTITNATILGSFSAAVGTNGGNIFFSTDAVTANGNDNNTISYCNIGPAGTNLPTKGIYGNGSTTTTAIGNSGIVIDNNNIYDFFGAAVASAGIYTGGGCNTWTITNNRFYQTAPRTWTTGANNRGIEILNSSATSGAQGFTITGNIVGYASAAGTGVYTLSGSTGKFAGIVLNGIAAGTLSTIANNTVAAVSLTGVTSNGTNNSSPFIGIMVQNGNAATNGNTIGNQSATGSLLYSTTTTTATDVYGMFNYGTDNWTATSNNIGGLTANNAGATGAFIVYGMRANTSTSVSFNATSNLVGGTIADSIQNNSTSTTAQIVGITSANAACNFSQNTVRNLTAAGGTGTTTTASVIGILPNTTSVAHTISRNTIHTLRNSNLTAVTTVTGIQYTGSGGANLVERNFIHSLTAASPIAIVNGINVSGGTTTYRNNMIRLGIDAAGNAITPGIAFSGISEPLGTDNFWFNSVYVGGSGVGGSVATYAFNSQQTTNTRVFQNNVFVNARSNGAGTGKHYAVRVGGTGANPTGLTINYNVYLASGTGSVFGYFNGADVTSLAAWRTAVGQDLNSFNSDPMYVNPTGTAATLDLHIQPPPTVTVVEANGFAIGSVTDDFDGQTRASLTPTDIGADADNFTGIDLTGPTISYTPLGNTTLVTNRTLSSTITDLSGVPTTGLGLPVIYFRKGTSGAYSSTQCASTGGSGYGCLIDYTLVAGGSVTTGDTVQYWIAAQDIPGNVSVSPTAGSSGYSANPPTASTPPTSPSSYVISPAITGTKTVCASGCDYATLTGATGAFNALNTSVATGNIDLQIAGDLTTGEDGSVALNAIVEEPTGSNFTVKIYPTGSARAITSTTAPTGGFIRLNAADRITIDGSIGGAGTDRSLTITEANTGTTSAVIWLQSSGTDGATSDTIKNLAVVGYSNSTTLIGIGMGSSTVGASSLGTNNGGNIIQNNDVRKVQIGIYSQGASSAIKNIGNVITKNVINAASPNNVSRIGILVGFENGIQITENAVGGMLQTSTNDAFGISLGISGITTSTYTGNEVIGATVARNVIGTVQQTNTYSACGICVAPTATATVNLIANNVLTGVAANGTSSDFSVGILIGGGGASTQIYYNSVSMNGTLTGGSEKSYALAVGGTDPIVDIRDNALYNTQSNGSGSNYAVGFGYSTFVNLTSNNNDFFVTTPSAIHFVGATASLSAPTSQATLANLQSATGKDGASIGTDPLFSNPTSNLQPQVGSPLVAAGAPISVIVDITGASRSGTAPTIGAYEGTLDTTGPTIAYTPLPNTTSTANRTQSITVTDPAGVPTGFGLPVIYFRKGTSGAYASTQCSGTGGSGYDCVIDYTLVAGGSVTTGDTVQYYIAAQDLLDNVAVNPAAGASGLTANPPAAATPPTSPRSYLVALPLSGTKTICASGCDYATLTGATGAFNALNSSVATGDIELQIAGDLTSGEDGSVALNALAEEPASNSFTVKIYPTGAPRAITSTADPTGGFIRLNGTDRVTIDGSIGGTGTDRSLTVTESNGGTATAVIWLQSSGSDVLGWNTIQNLNVIGYSNTTTLIGIGIGGPTVGISSYGAAAGSNTIRNNSVIRTQVGIFLQGASTSMGGFNEIVRNQIDAASPNNVSWIGILAGWQYGLVVNDNVVSGMSQSSSADVFGISLGLTAISTSSFSGNYVQDSSVMGNKIGSVRQTGTYSACGICVAPTVWMTNYIGNNVVTGVSAKASGGDFSVGIFVGGSSTGTTQIAHNAVSMNGTQTGGSEKSYALAIGGSDPIVDIRDNALYNTQNNGTGANYAIGLGYATFTNLTSDNNDFFVTTPSAIHFVGGTGSLSSPTNQATLASLQMATSKDAASISGDPIFTDPTSDLTPQLGSPLVGAGVSIYWLSTDITGATRSLTTPTIGAYENPIDTFGPTVTYTPLANTTSTANQLFPITATDVSGVPTSGIGLPTLYFRKGTSGSYTANPCVFTVASGYDCTIDYSLVGGVVGGETIQYYVAAQDTLGNVSVNPAAGASGLTPNPPAASIPPTSPASYRILLSLSGSYNVGATETRTSLTNPGGIFELINSNLLAGNVTIEITSDLTGETGAVALNAWTEQGAGGYSVTIKPNGAPRSITGSGTGTAVIKLNGADRVTIDGSLSGGTDRSLTISNPNTSTTSTVLWIGSASATDGATNDTVKNVILMGQASTTTSTGIIAGSGTSFGSAAEAPNSGNTIRNNLIYRAQNAVYIQGNSALDQGWLVTGNTFGSTVAAEKMIYRGMFLGNAQNFAITNNSIFGVVSTASSTSTSTGIQLGLTLSGGTISGNTIHDIKQANSSGWGSNGIFLAATSTTSNVDVFNNFIYDVASYGYNGFTAADNGYGIMVQSGGGYRLFHNSVRMTTNQTATTGITAAINVSTNIATAGSLDIRDNVFANSQTIGTRYAIYCAATNTVFSSIDFNDYWPGTGTLGYLGAARATLAAWQTATGKDAASLSVDPSFVSTTDLHLETCSAMSPMIGVGTPIASVTVDIDNDPRSPSTPDVGADETVRFTITSSAGSNGVITPTGAVNVGRGCDKTFTITPADCYSVADVLVDGSSVGAVTTYTFTNVQASHTISATFAIIPYTITASAGAGGSISPSGSVGVSCGATQGFTITPDPCYLIADVLVDGSSIGAASNYTFTNVQANHTIAASFVPGYTITASAGAGGSITPSGAVSVSCGGTQSFTITPNGCYTTLDVVVDGSSVGAVPSYTFTNVLANHTIAASFVLSGATYTITASAGTGGSISPSGSIPVNCGDSQGFTITPDAGWVVDDLLVDSSSVGAPGSYTFTNVQAAHTIAASFRAIVGAVPDRQSLGSPFMIFENSANPDHLDFSWGDSCGAAQSDFAVFQGTAGSWTSHAPILSCTTGGGWSISDFNPATNDSYYLVVPLSATAEGSYGTDSDGAQIPQGAGVCFATQDLTACP